MGEHPEARKPFGRFEGGCEKKCREVRNIGVIYSSWVVFVRYWTLLMRKLLSNHTRLLHRLHRFAVKDTPC